MSMLDLFAGRGFKASKCKTLLKLTIPRIKLLRNRREVQIKQMRREIAKLLETGQEATARIRVEHIVREEKMMAAQEILELFSELIAVRLPVIEAQRECPLDLKEAISSVCFAAPRCGDLTELQQIPMLFASKYGNEFVAAATELRPDCGVNRKLVELLSVRAPSPETKLKLLKEIAEEHELDWDPADTETEFFKNHEDLLDGTKRFVSGSKMPLPEEKHEDTLLSASDSVPNMPKAETDDDFDELDFPEVPNVSLRPKPSSITTPTVSAPPAASPHLDSEHELPKHAPAASPHLESEHELPKHAGAFEYVSPYSNLDFRNVSDENLVDKRDQETPVIADAAKVEKQFVPPISPPYVASESVSVKPSDSPPARPKAQSGAAVDLQDVLAAAYTAAETAERAAAAARSVANLAQVRITELTEKSREKTPESMFENPFHDNLSKKLSSSPETPHSDHQNSGPEHQGSYRTDSDDHPSPTPAFPDVSSFERLKLGPESPITNPPLHEPDSHQPQRLPSMDDDPYFSYPNLFTSQNPNPAAGSHPSTDNSKAKYDP